MHVEKDINTEIVGLLYKKLAGSELSLVELEKLERWAQLSVDNNDVYRQLTNEKSLFDLIHERKTFSSATAWQQVSGRINNTSRRFVPAILRWSAAAAVLIFISIGAYLWINKPARKTSAPVEIAKTDIMPGAKRAILTLADGSRIILDSASDGQLAVQGNAVITKQNDQLIYFGGRQKNNPVSDEGYNTMSTPRGGQYQLTLPDQTKVWLNAESSISYPIVFNGATRTVRVTGEAYFEVAKNSKKPFIVQSNKDEIVVLGTSFNVNNYTDEPVSKTSLLTGAVKVNDKILQPGQAYSNGRVIQTNILQDVAWKNGYFNFNNLELKAVLRQLARWYDLQVVYEGKVPTVMFSGELPQNLTLSQVLKILDKMDVKFRFERNKLIVSP